MLICAGDGITHTFIWEGSCCPSHTAHVRSSTCGTTVHLRQLTEIISPTDSMTAEEIAPKLRHVMPHSDAHNRNDHIPKSRGALQFQDLCATYQRRPTHCASFSPKLQHSASSGSQTAGRQCQDGWLRARTLEAVSKCYGGALQMEDAAVCVAQLHTLNGVNVR